MIGVLLGFSVFALYIIYVFYLIGRPYIGWISLLIVSGISFTFGLPPFVVGGLHLSLLDAVFVGLVVAGIVRTLNRLKEHNTSRLIVAFYFVIFSFSLLRGILTNGFVTTMNESRFFISPILSMMYFLTVPVDNESLKKYVRSLFWLSGALIIVAVAAVMGMHVGASAVFIADPTTAAQDVSDGRVLNAAATSIVSLSFVFNLAWSRYINRSLWFDLLACGLAGLVLYMRHRSVWTMLLASVVVIAIRDHMLLRKLLFPVIFAGTAVLLLVTLSTQTKVNLANSQEFEFAVSDTTTFQWRVNGWLAEVYDPSQTALTTAVGKSIGSGFGHYDSTTMQYLDVAPHSEYIGEFSRVGIAGLFLFLVFLFRPLIRLWRFSLRYRDSALPTTPIWVAVLTGFAIYAFTYTLDPIHWALLGIANSLASRLTDEHHASIKAAPLISFSYSESVPETIEPRAPLSYLPFPLPLK